MKCDKWDGPKVCWKLVDPPEYDTCCILKSGVSVFSMYLSQKNALQHVSNIQEVPNIDGNMLKHTLKFASEWSVKELCVK